MRSVVLAALAVSVSAILAGVGIFPEAKLGTFYALLAMMFAADALDEVKGDTDD